MNLFQAIESHLFGSKPTASSILSTVETVATDAADLSGNKSAASTVSEVTSGLNLVSAMTGVAVATPTAAAAGINLADGKAEVAAEINSLVDSVDVTTSIDDYKAELKAKVDAALGVSAS